MKFDKIAKEIIKESRYGGFGRGPKGYDSEGNPLGGGYDEYINDPGGKKEAARIRDHDRGPWYLVINGSIFKQQGQPKSFDWKSGANKYALAIIKNKPELKDKVLLTKNPNYTPPAA
jgi:hypothetical protein